MENSSKVFRDNLSLQIKEKLKERMFQLKQAETSWFSDKLKEMMRLEIMENFKKEIDEMKSTPWYDRARQAHLEVNRAKRNLNKANLEKEILLQEYRERLAKADENIAENRKTYEDAEIKYTWEAQSHNACTWELTDDNDYIEEMNSYKNESSDDIDKFEEIQKIQSNNDGIINDNDEEKENNSKIENLEENNSSENNKDLSGIKTELFWDEEAVKEDLKKHVTIEKCVDETWYSGKKITINIPKVWNKFPGYKFECFVSDKKFKSINWVKNINRRFFYRDDLYRLLDWINSYMNIYWITRDKYGYNRDMLWEIDNCVGMECLKYITWLDSLYWLWWDLVEYKLNCTGKREIFISKDKRAHLLLIPSK